jgi:aspartate racemase
MMNEKVIGILGGMGPEATLDCFGKIIKNTPAQNDQDHLRVVIDSNPKVPDRTAAIMGEGESPTDIMVQGGRILEQAGADFIIIPCVSAHFFLKEVQSQINLPILSIFDAVAETIAQDHPNLKKIGLMATSGTVSGRLFQKRLADSGIETVVPDDAAQARIMAAIYDIKNAQSTRSRADITADLASVAQNLITHETHKVQGIIAGCTEIPLALSQEHLSVPYFDSPLLLARAAIRRAGIEPVPLT